MQTTAPDGSAKNGFAAYRLVGKQDPALGEQAFDVAKAEREPQVEPNRLLNDLRREPVTRLADFRHSPRLPRIQSASKSRRLDNANASPCFGSPIAWARTSLAGTESARRAGTQNESLVSSPVILQTQREIPSRRPPGTRPRGLSPHDVRPEGHAFP